jgi:DNA-binding response OmpR family regulator
LETKPKILIAKEEAPMCKLFEIILGSRGYQCAVAHNTRQVIELLKEADLAAALLDIRLPGMSFSDLLASIQSLRPSLSIVVLSDSLDIRVAIETMKAGAMDYITEPFDLTQVANAVESALRRKIRRIPAPFEAMAGESASGIEAIALGVEARQEILDGHSEIIVQQTISIARQMGFADEKIQAWVADRTEKRSRRIKQLTDSIIKVPPVNPVRNISAHS